MGPLVPTDLQRSALAYCTLAVYMHLDLAEAKNIRPGAVCPPSHGVNIFAEAVDAVGGAVGYEEVAEGSPAYKACLETLKRCAVACAHSAEITDVEATLLAHFGLGLAYAVRGERERAAAHYRKALAAAEGAHARLSPRAKEAFAMARRNLRTMEATTPLDHVLSQIAARAEMARDYPEHAATRVSAGRVVDGPVERPACAACGATPLTLKKCSGTCGGSERFCGAACFATAWPDHKKRLGCRARKTGT